MSSETMAWAVRVKIPHAPTKNMLMIVADLANHVTGEVYPSIAYLQEATGLNKRTVLAVLKRLVDMEILEPTEERKGKTNQIPVYHFHMVEGLPMIAKPSSNRRGAKIHPLGKSDGKEVHSGSETGAVLHGKQVQKCTTEPSIGNQVEEGSIKPPGVDKDLFGEDILTPEQLEAQRKAETVSFIEDRWRRLTEQIPMIAALRGGKLDDARAETALSRAAKFAVDGETEADVWRAIFDNIPRSRFLCGEVEPTGDRQRFTLQMTWLLEHRNFTKVLEGKYSDGRNPELPGGAGGRRSPTREAMSLVLDRNRASRNRGNGRGSGPGAVR